MAGSASGAQGSLPHRLDSATQVGTAPGTVTEPQPRGGIALCPAKRLGVQAAGERPEPLSPCKALPSQTMAKASLPSPFPDGSTTASVIAAASAASTALPPFSSIRRPA